MNETLAQSPKVRPQVVYNIQAKPKGPTPSPPLWGQVFIALPFIVFMIVIIDAGFRVY